MASPEEEFQQLIVILHGFQIRDLLMVSAATLVAYDVFLTFDREYKYIWQAKWTPSKVIYLIFRYIVIGWQLGLLGDYIFGVDTDVSLSYCKRMGQADVLQSVLLHQLGVFAITVRTSVLYQNQRSINLILGAGYLLNFFGMLPLASAIITRSRYTQGTLGLAMGCEALSVCEGCKLLARLEWVPVEVFEIFLCFMTVRRAMQQGRIFSTRLTTVLYRDGFAYFVIMFCCGSLQFLLIGVFYDNGYLTLIFWSLVQSIFRAIISVACSRMILNLRGVLTKPSEYDVSIYPTGEQPNISTMRFGEGPKATVDSTDGTSTYYQTTSGRDTRAESSAEEVELGPLSRRMPDQAQG